MGGGRQWQKVVRFQAKPYPVTGEAMLVRAFREGTKAMSPGVFYSNEVQESQDWFHFFGKEAALQKKQESTMVITSATEGTTAVDHFSPQNHLV